MTRREFAVWYAETWLGRWYTWAGDDPSGIDCSGLVVEVGKATGVLPRGKAKDWSADGLYQMSIRKGWIVSDAGLRPGAWVFYLNAEGTKAIHVELVSRNPAIAIGASGGGSSVRSVSDAIRENAFIKPRPWASRSGPRAFADPYWKDEIGLTPDS